MINENTLKITFVGEDKGVGSMLDGVKGALGGIMTVAGGIISAQIFTQIGNQIKSMAMEGFEAVKSAEQLTLQLESLVAVELRNTGAATDMTEAYAMSTEKAKELQGWLKKLALTSPFDSKTVQLAFSQAMSYGLTSEEAKKLTESTLNWGAATGKTSNQVQDLMFVLSQMNSIGEVTAMDLKQLAGRGLDLNLVAKELGVSVADLNDASPKDLINAFESISSSTYSAGLERASGSLAGIVGFFQDFKDQNLQVIFTEAFSSIKPLLFDLQGVLMSDAFNGQIKLIGERLGEFTAKAINFGKEFYDIALNIKDIGQNLLSGNYKEAFSELSEIFGSKNATQIIVFVENLKDLKDNVLGFSKAMSTEGGRTISLRKLLGDEDANTLIKTLNDIKKTFQDVWPQIEAAFTRAWIIIEPKWNAFVKSLNSGDFDNLIKTIGFLPTLIEVLAAAVIGVIGVITAIVTPILAIVDQYKTFLDTFMLDINLLLDGLKLVFEGFSQFITGLMTLNIEKIIEGFAKMGLGFSTVIFAILKTFTDGITNAFNVIKKFLTEQLKAFERFFFGEASNIGTFFIDGLINGIFGGMPRLVSAIQGILNAFKSTDLSSLSSNSYGNSGSSGGIGVNYTANGTGQNGYTGSNNINNNSNRSFNFNIENFNGTPQDLYQTGKIVYQIGADNGWTR